MQTCVYTYKQTNRHIIFIHEWLEHFSKQAPSISLICTRTDRQTGTIGGWSLLAHQDKLYLCTCIHIWWMEQSSNKYTYINIYLENERNSAILICVLTQSYTNFAHIHNTHSWWMEETMFQPHTLGFFSFIVIYPSKIFKAV